ncbi:NfeD family protein [Acinetobacter shaoyimingii]|uniref:NfeD family protein n=1 Tax=Acinetobacter shaoyimingii TaxID=2715164 RepID=A0A6G8RXL9_9GAMM|nr:NfeD family protein [Acinetobacter shaoyimingii]NHB57688.1 NfeD family protein [Acinetobacter shaoyimingii]QIO06615.1 NfeD family protein [Acinetobacter shaoyimingii]
MNLVIEPWHWFVLGTVLIISELFIPAFAALWFGLAALVVGILLWVFPEMNLGLQLIIWGILSIVCTLLWFKYIKPRANRDTQSQIERENTIGKTGMVILTHLEQDHIRVRFTTAVLGADEWNCRTVSPVQVGDRVRVIDILDNELLVQPYSTTTTPL